MTEKNIEYLKEIKKDFFRYRNGEVANQLKKLYPENTLIFGLNLPQISEISKKFPKDLDLAMALWNDNKVRESRILSLYLFPIENLTFSQAQQMVACIESSEEAEVLPFRILRYLPFKQDLYNYLSEKSFDTPLEKYCFEMFKRNLEVLNL